MSLNFESSLALVETSTDAYREDDSATVAAAVDRLGSLLGWAREGKGPFGSLIEPGAARGRLS